MESYSINLIITCLAVWRITSVIQNEKIARQFRKLVGAVEDEETIVYPDTFFGNLFSCFRCLSFWVAVACSAIFFLFPYALYPFAINAVAIIIDEKI